MFQLFKNSVSFAFQELKARCWFWYTLFIKVFLQAFLVGTGFGLLSVVTVGAALRILPYMPQNYAMIWTVILWSLVSVIIAFLAYFFVAKIVRFMMNLMATTLASAQDEKPTALVSVKTIVPFAQLMSILSIFLAFAMLGKVMIVTQTGSQFFGELFFLIISLGIGMRLHFAYFILLEKTTFHGSFLHNVCASLQQSLKLTRGKFGQLLWVVLFVQISSVISTMITGFNLWTLWSPQTVVLVSAIFFLLVFFLTPLITLMSARSYVLLTRAK